MPIPLPNLDDRTYADLFAEMRALIPRYAPAWTDHNDSDPGIMLLQLFAWLTEGTIYRLNRIPLASELGFLKLLGGGASAVEGDQPASALTAEALDQMRGRVVAGLRARSRAITPEDFEALVMDEGSYAELDLPSGDYRVARAKCLPERDLTAKDLDAPRPGHVSVILVPRSGANEPTPSPQLLDAAWQLLDARRLITCRHHVVGPTFTRVRAEVALARTAQFQDETVRDLISANLKRFFHPLTGGPDGNGWPFGRDVYASEVYQVVEGTQGVDHVETLRLKAQGTDGTWIDADDCVDVPENSLVHFLAEATGPGQPESGRAGPGDIRVWEDR